MTVFGFGVWGLSRDRCGVGSGKCDALLEWLLVPIGADWVPDVTCVSDVMSLFVVHRLTGCHVTKHHHPTYEPLLVGGDGGADDEEQGG